MIGNGSAPPDVRWRPARAGIRNVWEYDDQVFEFADGRLILRGPNGSGKSNALALLFPFLFDATMSAARMDPFAGGRSMRALLLSADRDGDGAGRRFRYDQRTGYVWLELTRGDEHGTLGCGVRATAQRDADAWFFVTARRPGIDLDLTPGGVPLTRPQLVDELGRDAVFETAEAYRDAVDRALFGIGRDRYRNLIELVLRLRRPHLAGKLQLEELSRVLSDGLAALDPVMVADVAASFEDLEAVQRDLARLQEAEQVVAAFSEPYVHYLRTVAAGRAAETLAADRARQRCLRERARAERRVVELTEALTALSTQLEANELGEVEADARRRAQLESPAYRDATALNDLLAHRRDARAAVEAAVARRERSAEQLAHADQEVQRADQAHHDAAASAERHQRETAAGADRAGIAWTVRLDPPVDPATLDAELRYGSTERRNDLAAVRVLLRVAEETATRASEARAHASASAAAVEAARALVAANEASAATALDDYCDALHAWATAHEVVEPDDAATLEALARDLEVDLAELVVALGGCFAPRSDALVARASELAVQRSDLAGQQEERRGERARVAAISDPGPDPLPTRPTSRAGRAGAPLYACCDFAPGLDTAQTAALEAALEASGLLDAWVLPGGGLDAEALDAFVVATPAAHGPTMIELLVPTPPANSGLQIGDVDVALHSLGRRAGPVRIDVDGSYQLGPLRGRYTKAEPEYIGATARAQRRARLLAELDGQIETLDQQLATVAGEIDAVSAARAALRAAQSSLPAVRPLADARRAVERFRAGLAVAESNAERDEQRAASLARTASETRAALAADAGGRSLPTDATGLDDIAGAVADYERRAGALVGAIREVALRDEELGRQHAQRERARAECETREEELRTAQHAARAIEARVDELQTRLGPDAEEPLRALAAIEAEIERLRSEHRRLLDERRGLDGDLGAARTAAEQTGRDLERSIAAAEASVARLNVLHRADVREAVFGAGTEVGADEPLALAERVRTALDGVIADDEARAAARDRVLSGYKRLLDELRHGYDPALTEPDDVIAVEVLTDSGTIAVLQLAAMLAEQVARQRELLSERDRQVFERHLLTRVSEALRELLNQAREFVERVNECLSDTPTASGMRIELRWEPTSDDRAQRHAITLLLRSPELLGPDERERLREFFAGAIQTARAVDPGLGYQAVLEQVLDYRAWHGFTPFLRTATGAAQRLTRTVFRTLSGGEQAVALHLPLFAAAAAHYGSARSDAPRLIALDEAFAGIDERMRGELMGLLVRFDLDVIMTGHELWGAYEEVPAVAVYDLLRRPPVEGVSALAMRWDGARLLDA